MRRCATRAFVFDVTRGAVCCGLVGVKGWAGRAGYKNHTRKGSMRRSSVAIGNGPAAELLVTVDDGSKRHSGRVASHSIFFWPTRSGLFGIGATLLFAVLTARESCHFCTSRCYLIDWSADTLLTSVPTVHTQDELDERIAAHEPALLHGALRSWPAVGKWSPEFFGASLGARHVEIFFWGRSGADWLRTRV